jgi:hypothetical protein
LSGKQQPRTKEEENLFKNPTIDIVVLNPPSSSMSGIPDEDQATAVAGLMKDATMTNNNTTMVDSVHYDDTQQQQQSGMPGLVVHGDEYFHHYDDDDDNVLPQQQQQRRRAHVFFGCCCDTRKAVLVINIFSLCLHCLSFVIYLEVFHPINPDRVGTSIDLALAAIPIICNGITIYGVDQYNQTAILIGGLWWVLESVSYVTYRLWDVVIIAPIVIYPHAVLYYEMKSGIISRETYPHEKHCCGCC